MKQLVKLWKRPSQDGDRFTYYLLYTDEQGRRRQKSLGHANTQRALIERAELEWRLRSGRPEPKAMRLSIFLEDSVQRSRGQVREATLAGYRETMKHFLSVVGNIDYRKVEHAHGERFIQACVDGGNALATAHKKITVLKRLFQMAVERGQLERNPFRFVRKPKVPSGPVRVFSPPECVQLLDAADVYSQGQPVRWDLLILAALMTGLRRGELLNLLWEDIHFESQTMEVTPKLDTARTWQWHIKDSERRTVPLPRRLADWLTAHRATQPMHNPYVFVPARRYDRIMKLHHGGHWTALQGRCPINNFTRRFVTIRTRAGIETGEFHDLRRTALSNWITHGLSEFDVMRMAGHSTFETTRKFYLAVRTDLVDRARVASDAILAEITGQARLQQPQQRRIPRLPGT